MKNRISESKQCMTKNWMVSCGRFSVQWWSRTNWKGRRCRPWLYVYHMNLTVQKWTYASSLLVMKQVTIIYYKNWALKSVWIFRRLSYQSTFPKETQTIKYYLVCFKIYVKEIYFEDLAHMMMEAGNSKISDFALRPSTAWIRPTDITEGNLYLKSASCRC